MPTTPWYSTGDSWNEDDGSGVADVTNYHAGFYVYAQRSWEEARCSLPAGAPENFAANLLVGRYDTNANLPNINCGGTAPVNTPSPPVAGQGWMPWWNWAKNRFNTVVNSNRFSCEYADPLAVCTNDIELEP